MTSYNRAQTINSLAMAMGVKPVSQNDLKRFDSASGTFYCNDKNNEEAKIESAIAYFENMKKNALRSISTDSHMVAEFCSTAIDALHFVQQKTAEDTGNKAV